MFDFLTGFVPRRLRDLFLWMEYLYYNSAQIFAALKKFSEYPITDISYDTQNAAQEERVKELLEKTINVKNVLITCGRDRWIYGNAFISVFQPFVRFLLCPRCGKLVNIKHVNYRFRYRKKPQFRYKCRKCKNDVTGKVVDRKITDPKQIHIIRWDPKQMDIDYNPISGKSVYYYSIPGALKQKIEKGNKHLLNSMPLSFIKASHDNKMYQFNEGQIYHMKVEPPAGIDQQWGFPPLTAAIKLFFYAAVLRKANEAVALDHLVPFRIIYPQAASSGADPVQTIALGNLFDNVKEGLRLWRRDPLTIMHSPVPVGTAQLGGDGRALLTLGEVKEAEDGIIAAMGIPREFVYGGLSFTGSAITLRMLENQLLTYTSELNDLLQWVTDKSTKMLGWAKTSVELTEFKLIDDVQQKQVLLSLNQQQQMISNTTIAELHDFDLKKERDRRMQEQLDEVRFQQELQQKVTKMQDTLAQQAQRQAMMGRGNMQYDQQQIIANADTIVEQLMQMDQGMRKSQLHALQMEDMVMYSVVIQRLEQAQLSQAQEAKQAG
ncbi:MAG: hypothetical protein CMK74_00670 [Pseudomonadales bacterium]|nr:hypothetical protein [Pseudomonadales bacterium]